MHLGSIAGLEGLDHIRGGLRAAHQPYERQGMVSTGGSTDGRESSRPLLRGGCSLTTDGSHGFDVCVVRGRVAGWLLRRDDSLAYGLMYSISAASSIRRSSSLLLYEIVGVSDWQSDSMT